MYLLNKKPYDGLRIEIAVAKKGITTVGDDQIREHLVLIHVDACAAHCRNRRFNRLVLRHIKASLMPFETRSKERRCLGERLLGIVN